MTRLILAPFLSGSFVFRPDVRVRDVCKRDVDMHAVSSEDIKSTQSAGSDTRRFVNDAAIDETALE